MVTKPPVGARCAVKEVRAHEAIRRMQGGAQAHLIRTDDGCYVCKWKENPQHRRVLINEAIGAQLLRAMEIATPDWAIVMVDEEFVAANPSACISLEGASIPVTTGPHFGSKVIVEAELTGIYDFLPQHLFDRVVNLDDFLKVLVFDLWTDNHDGRQAIFFAERGGRTSNRSFKVQMIDNGCAFGFGGGEWRMRDRFVGKAYPHLKLFYLSNSAAEPIAAAITAARSIPEADFDGILDSLPEAWIQEDRRAIKRMFGQLRQRADRLPGLVAQALDVIRNEISLPG
jgi:hypothetical protein